MSSKQQIQLLNTVVLVDDEPPPVPLVREPEMCLNLKDSDGIIMRH